MKSWVVKLVVLASMLAACICAVPGQAEAEVRIVTPLSAKPIDLGEEADDVVVLAIGLSGHNALDGYTDGGNDSSLVLCYFCSFGKEVNNTAGLWQAGDGADNTTLKFYFCSGEFVADSDGGHDPALRVDFWCSAVTVIAAINEQEPNPVVTKVLSPSSKVTRRNTGE